MSEIIPAILVRRFQDLEESLERIKDVARMVQIDVVDGILAPTTTWPYKDEQRFARMVAGDEGLPLWDSFDFEFDLMVSDPALVVETYVGAGATRIVLHAKSKNVQEAMRLLQPVRLQVELPIQVGVAIMADASPEVLKEFEGMFDYIQIMGIEQIGQQGSVLGSNVVPAIEALRLAYPDMNIQVDGGVNVSNARSLVEAGANRLVAGSAIFASDNPHAALRALQKEANR